jgi:hypothetical protein
MCLRKHKGPRPELENVMTKSERVQLRLRTGQLRNRSSIPGRYKDLYFLKRVRRGVRPTQSPSQGILTGGSFFRGQSDLGMKLTTNSI